MSRFYDRYFSLKRDLDECFSMEERYLFIIDLGRQHCPSTNIRLPENLLPGCQSHAWLQSRFVNQRLLVECDSDALIVKGLLALLSDLVSGFTQSDLLDLDWTLLKDFHHLELTPSRSNGFASAVLKLDRNIRELLGKESSGSNNEQLEKDLFS